MNQGKLLWFPNFAVSRCFWFCVFVISRDTAVPLKANRCGVNFFGGCWHNKVFAEVVPIDISNCNHLTKMPAYPTAINICFLIVVNNDVLTGNIDVFLIQFNTDVVSTQAMCRNQ